MLAINFKPPGLLLSELGNRAKLARLRLNLSRQTLSERSGVPASSIKRFETTGLIGSASLVDILFALDRLDELTHLFDTTAVPTIAELDSEKHRRQRGRQ
jgi:transcriptional regulator with XRE-family HTH domain